MGKVIISLSLFFSSLVVIAAISELKHEKYVMCKNQKVVRTLRVVKKEENGNTCETLYTKAGVDRVVGRSKTLLGCDDFLNNVKGNLEKAAWKCKDISKAQIHMSESLSE